MERNDLGPSMVALTTGIGLFTTFLPPLTEVRKNSRTDSEFVSDVRWGQAAAAALTLSLGGIAAVYVNDPAPLILAVAFAGGLVLLYEMALRNTGATAPVPTMEGH